MRSLTLSEAFNISRNMAMKLSGGGALAGAFGVIELLMFYSGTFSLIPTSNRLYQYHFLSKPFQLNERRATCVHQSTG